VGSKNLNKIKNNNCKIFKRDKISSRKASRGACPFTYGLTAYDIKRNKRFIFIKCFKLKMCSPIILISF